MSERLSEDAKRALDAARLRVSGVMPEPAPMPKLEKRPVAWRVKDFADGWMLFQDERTAQHIAELTGAVIQGLYVRDGT